MMTGSASDPVKWQQHIRNKGRREGLAKRFRDTSDTLKMVLVRDMWLTGFDAPSLHTMYADKPMRGHNLMQAIARVNRVFKDKPGGLIVDYLGLAPALQSAVQTYTESGGTGNAVEDWTKIRRWWCSLRDMRSVKGCSTVLIGRFGLRWISGSVESLASGPGACFGFG